MYCLFYRTRLQEYYGLELFASADGAAPLKYISWLHCVCACACACVKRCILHSIVQRGWILIYFLPQHTPAVFTSVVRKILPVTPTRGRHTKLIFYIFTFHKETRPWGGIFGVTWPRTHGVPSLSLLLTFDLFRWRFLSKPRPPGVQVFPIVAYGKIASGPWDVSAAVPNMAIGKNLRIAAYQPDCQSGI